MNAPARSGTGLEVDCIDELSSAHHKILDNLPTRSAPQAPSPKMIKQVMLISIHPQYRFHLDVGWKYWHNGMRLGYPKIAPGGQKLPGLLFEN